MSRRLFISEFQTLSSLGHLTTVDPHCTIVPRGAEYRWGFPVFPLHAEAEQVLQIFTGDEKTPPDRTTLLALAASAGACESLARVSTDTKIGVSIGSSRGPTTSIEESYGSFVRQMVGRNVEFSRGRRGSVNQNDLGVGEPVADAPHLTVPPHTSPRTTAGTISSSVGQRILQLRRRGSTIERKGGASEILSLGTSMTCSSAFHSILIGVGMLRSGLVDKWVFGGAEAPLTPYTLAQMEALGIYTHYALDAPCRPGVFTTWRNESDEGSRSSFTLGEGSGVGILSSEHAPPPTAIFEVVGIGWGMERAPSPSGISDDGDAFYAAMESALAGIDRTTISGVVAHAPGTLKGDRAELAAIRRIFERHEPTLLSSKHLTGHTFGTSGVLSLEIVRAVAAGISLPNIPEDVKSDTSYGRRFLVNSGGFGGNAISVVVDWLG